MHHVRELPHHWLILWISCLAGLLEIRAQKMGIYLDIWLTYFLQSFTLYFLYDNSFYVGEHE